MMSDEARTKLPAGNQSTPSLFFSAGEPSGDLHAATLLREIRRLMPDLLAFGYGGRHLASAGCHLYADLTQWAVMWFGRAFLHLPRFVNLWQKAAKTFRTNPPAGVILVDFPGFNWWIARAAKRCGIPVFYYVPPQVWAWARWRVHKMRRLTDLVLCTLPFEADFFRQHGCSVVYIGHPFFDYLSQRALDRAFINSLRLDAGPWVTLLPGSRMQELEANYHILLRVAREVAKCRPATRFAVAAFSSEHAQWLQEHSAEIEFPLHIWAGKTQELIHIARCCVAVSGSVSLELLYHEKPAAIVYHIPASAWLAQGFFRQVRYICLVNLLAAQNPLQPGRRWPGLKDQDGTIYPEFLTYRDPSAAIAEHVLGWLSDPAAYNECRRRLRQLKEAYGQPGAAGRAAACVVGRIFGQSSPDARRDLSSAANFAVPPPHWFGEESMPGRPQASSSRPVRISER
ncbi:MAG: hypothetical protein NZ899_09440 [Thermoguttaceae bacterium]|nr:hypothetical protein [Thermoguttaceae bacterium]MDW8079325.1 hypothetical protein [Thermoguttaceae bacterium]